jgi:very-short-patch-repair endonuclease
MTLVDRARTLRKSMTPQEVKLWLRLRALRPLGFRFRRQAPLMGRIVDFACFSTRLIVEADGGQHFAGRIQRTDALRDAMFHQAGFRVLRFSNVEIDRTMDGVLDAIVSAMPPSRRALPATLPARGREANVTDWQTVTVDAAISTSRSLPRAGRVAPQAPGGGQS